jgi:hypothetical protein
MGMWRGHIATLKTSNAKDGFLEIRSTMVLALDCYVAPEHEKNIIP